MEDSKSLGLSQAYVQSRIRWRKKVCGQLLGHVPSTTIKTFHSNVIILKFFILIMLSINNLHDRHAKVSYIVHFSYVTNCK